MGGIKFDNEKAMLDLIPSELEDQVGRVMTFGAKKYARANWAKGIVFSRLLSATRRHLNAWNKGIDIDPESGLNHIAHAATNLAFLLYFIENRPDLDDRWVKELTSQPESLTLSLYGNGNSHSDSGQEFISPDSVTSGAV